MTVRRSAVLALLGVAALAGGAGAQRRPCDIEFLADPGTNPRARTFLLPSGQRNTFVGGGVHAVCRRDRISIRADSAEHYGDERRLFLVGNVKYDEPRAHMTSDFLTYFGVDERVVASSNVTVRLPNGSTMVGPQAEYLRVYPARPQSVLTAIGRPTIALVERAAPGTTPEPPTTVVATTVIVIADSLLHGVGQVEITRPDLTARGDSAFMNTGVETMRLMRQPSIEGKRGRPYRLEGEVIDVFSRRRKLERVLSLGNARATSEDMRLSSDTLRLDVSADLLQEAWLWGRGRSRIQSPAQDIEADSIRIEMPAQRLRVVRAVRAARAEALPDTARLNTTDRDWLRGDTILAHFDTTAPPVRDSTSRPRIERLLATGDARSYYHLPPTDTTASRPAINYVRGRNITVTFDSARVADVAVVGKSHGVYLEPVADTARRPAADSTARPATTPAGGRPAPGVPVTGASPGPVSPVRRPEGSR